MPDANITKSALAASMKRLMKEKVFSKISVVDICDGCGMNRKSFYYHFKDKYDLVNWIFYTDFIALVSTHAHEDGWSLMTSICNLFYQDQDFYRGALHIEGQNSFREYFQESMSPIAAYFLQSGDEDDDEVEDFAIKLFCNAYLTTITEWLEQGCQFEPAEFVDNMKQLILRLAKKMMQDSGTRDLF